MEYIYNGKVNSKLYALTITTRNDNTKESFVNGLNKYLIDIKYNFKIVANIEQHKQKKQYHLHGTTSSGQPPTNNKTNEYYFHLKKIKTTPTLWYEYMYKDYKLEVCLFDDSSSE